MSAPSRSDVPPTSIGIDLREEGVVVEYLDGRTTLYSGLVIWKTGNQHTLG